MKRFLLIGLLLNLGSGVWGDGLLIDNCEDGNGTNLLGGSWYTYNDLSDGGNSTVNPTAGGTFTMTSGGATSSPNYAAKYSYFLGNSYIYRFAGMGTTLANFAAGEYDVNISTYRGVNFWVKGNGHKQRIELVSNNITDFDYYYYEFTTPTQWTYQEVSWTNFHQQGFGVSKELTECLNQMRKIQFKASSQVNGENGEVSYDDLWLLAYPDPQSTPRNLVATPGAWGRVILEWEYPGSDNIIYYTIYRATSEGFTPSAGNLLSRTTDFYYYDTSTQDKVTYYYQIKAQTTAESSASNEAQATADFNHSPVIHPRLGLDIETLDTTATRVRLVIPQSAVESTTAISISPKDHPLEQQYLPAVNEAGIIFTGLAREFMPRLRLKKSGTLRMDYRDSDWQNAGIPEEEQLAIFYYDEYAGNWIKLGGTVDKENNTVTANIGHFTTFGIFGDTRENLALIDSNWVNLHPNPFTPNGDGINDVLYIDFSLAERADLTLLIFDNQGDLVRTISGVEIAYPDGDSYGQITWDGRDDSGRLVESGLYIFYMRVKDRSCYYRDFKVRKLIGVFQ